MTTKSSSSSSWFIPAVQVCGCCGLENQIRLEFQALPQYEDGPRKCHNLKVVSKDSNWDELGDLVKKHLGTSQDIREGFFDWIYTSKITKAPDNDKYLDKYDVCCTKCFADLSFRYLDSISTPATEEDFDALEAELREAGKIV